MAEVLGNIVFILLLVLANGFFVSAEFAIVKVRSSQIVEKMRKGNRYAPLAKHIVEHLDAYLSATQLGITLASLGLGWMGEPLLADMMAKPLTAIGIFSEGMIHGISFTISFAILTFLHIVLGELAPKSLAIQHPETTTFIVSLPLQLFYRIFKPAIWALNETANFFLRLSGIPQPSSSDLLHSPEELEIIVQEGAKSGVLTKTEQELLSSIFEFSSTTAKEVMVPRTEMVALDLDFPREVLVRKVVEEGYSRMPVYKDSLDNVLGVIYSKDLITLLEHRELIILHDIIHPAYFVPESVKVSQLMRDLQQRKLHMAIVVDEFGGTQGLITMEDILEEIVGEIHDEYDEVLKEFEHSTDGSALVDTRISISDFNEKFSAAIPDDTEYETLAGFLGKQSGKVLAQNEELQYENLHFKVLKTSQRRIRQVRVKKIEIVPPA
ncbi:MAG: HlyC/CorC family transporter [Bacteroidetes bacterium]|nr:MAG: HlyC/CorC family transporter [Bacteroidota bacterium]